MLKHFLCQYSGACFKRYCFWLLFTVLCFGKVTSVSFKTLFSTPFKKHCAAGMQSMASTQQTQTECYLDNTDQQCCLDKWAPMLTRDRPHKMLPGH